MDKQELERKNQQVLAELDDFSRRISSATRPVRELLEVQASYGNRVAEQLLFEVEHLRNIQVHADERIYQEINAVYQKERGKG